MKKVLVLGYSLLTYLMVVAYLNVKTKEDKSKIMPRQINDQTHLNKKGPKIFLKLDDFDARNGKSDSSPAMDYLMNKEIKVAIGFIAIRCDQSTLSVYAPYLNAKNELGEPLFEVWHHGLDHINPEFVDKDYEYQKAHFEQADQRIRELFRLQMHSFGAPFNHNDAITNKVIAENPNYKVTMFNNPSPDAATGILNLDQRVNMEIATGKPNYEAFLKNYNAKKGSYTDYMVLQGHPKFWKVEELNQFKQIIDFLISEGCEFDLPYHYYQSKNPQSTKPTQIQKIIFDPLSVKKLSDSDFDPKAKSSSGLKVFYNSSNPKVATILDGKIHIVGLGTTVITASQMGDNKFKPADYVSQTLKID